LSFDVYGTLIDWETGILTALEPLLAQCSPTSTPTSKELLAIFHELESKQQTQTPDLPYSALLASVYPQLAEKLGLRKSTHEEEIAFGNSVGKWPAFPDTVNALRRLKKHYKLVVLSNVDRESFSASNAGPLDGVSFDGILTAQDIGSYKPDLHNFEYMLDFIKKEWGFGKADVLPTAQSQFHDHHPARKMGLKSVWIVRPGSTMGNQGEEIFDWRFDTLGEMADAVESQPN